MTINELAVHAVRAMQQHAATPKEQRTLAFPAITILMPGIVRGCTRRLRGRLSPMGDILSTSDAGQYVRFHAKRVLDWCREQEGVDEL